MEDAMQVNKYQTPITDELLDSLEQEVREQFIDFINNVPYIKSLISKDRKYAKDLPRDDTGKIIVDITEPHILEDMDYFRPVALHYEKYGTITNLRPNPNPNSEYGKWIREEVRRCFEGYVRPTDGEWVTGDYYFFLNYCPMLLSKKSNDGNYAKRVIGFPLVWEGHYYKFHYLWQARNNGKHAAELASRSKGKAHPYSQIVYTPSGPKLWGDIKVGDELFGDDGLPTKVIAIPFDEETDIYKVTLSDGRTIECSLGHLFRVRDSRKANSNMTNRIMSLEEIINDDYYHLRSSGRYESYISLPVNHSVEFNKVDVLIDPYTLGLILGDGCLRTGYVNSVMFTSRDSDIEIYRRNTQYDIDKIKGKYSYRIRIPNVKLYLDYYGLNWTDSSTKFIPKDYIFNTKEVRLSILQGILDTDGTVNNNGIPMLTTTSERLANDVIFICRSLGYNTRMFKKQGKYNGRICKITYNISILTNDKVFRLPRKLSLLTTFPTTYSKARKDWTHIVNIEYSHRERAKCVTVDNSSHCYLIGDFVVTHNSFCAAAMLAKRFILGESKDVQKKVVSYIVAFDKAKLVGGDQTLDKFQYNIDFCANNTQFPSKRLINTIQNMQWQMGYIDLDSGTKKGTLNAVVGKSYNDSSKLRGSRGVLYLFEEAGSFSNLLESYNNLRPSVEEGEDVFGMLYLFGTAGDDQSDFSAMQEIMYNAKGYNVYSTKNIYDKEGQGRSTFAFFFPGYLNRSGCYDENGNSDVVKALIQILKDRYIVKYNSSDINSITKRIAEIPITPQEAILRTTKNIFPVIEINNRINEIDNNSNFFSDVYVGNLIMDKSGNVSFMPTTDIPIRDFPLKDNKATGAIEIYEMPLKVHDKIPPERYIASLDNYENDESGTMSLGSIFVLDLWTDRIVAEYTGRPMFADDLNEIARKMCIFYNAKMLYENNKKNTFAYFSKMNCLHLLADTPEYLKQKQIVKTSSFGNSSKGVSGTVPVFNFAYLLIRDWLLKPVTITKEEQGEEVQYTVANLHFIKNRALLKELALFNPDINVDRIKSLCQLMLYREEKMILYQGNPQNYSNTNSADYLGNDPFFTKNYDERIVQLDYKQ